MKYFLLLSLLPLLAACGSSKEVVETTPPPIVDEPTSPLDEDPQKNVLVESSLGSFEESDALDIDSLYIEGNKLFLHVHYSGGCEEHQFKLIGSPVVMKSLPPKRSVQLVHDNKDDACKSIVHRVLEADLKTLSTDQTPGSTIVLLLKGWQEDIMYTFE